MPKVFMWVVHLHRQLEFLFFDFFLADDIFFARSVDLSAYLPVLLVLSSVLAEKFFFAKKLQMI